VSSAAPEDVIVLAGDRGPNDPVAASQRVAGKVLVELAGRSLLARALDAVAALPAVRRVWLVCPDRAEYLEIARAALPERIELNRLAPADGPAASVAAALARAGQRPALVITGDHPLLRPEWLADFAARAVERDADAVAGVADARRVAERFPDSRRTRYRFADVPACGTNLFWFAAGQGEAVADAWRAFERDRKRPWKMVSKLGWGTLLRYLTGRLTLDRAAVALSDALGLRLALVLVDDPEAAVDVDSLDDLRLAGQVLRERGDQTC